MRTKNYVVVFCVVDDYYNHGVNQYRCRLFETLKEAEQCKGSIRDSCEPAIFRRDLCRTTSTE